jgi:pentatricopeptide repeat protein
LFGLSHSGLSSISLSFFSLLPFLSPPIYPTIEIVTTIIDSLCRDNRFDDAFSFYNEWEKKGLTDIISVTLTSILGACRTHNDIYNAIKVIDILDKKNQIQISHCIIMSNICISLHLYNFAKSFKLLQYDIYKNNNNTKNQSNPNPNSQSKSNKSNSKSILSEYISLNELLNISNSLNKN